MIVGMALDLQVDDPDLMARAPGRFGDELQSQRLQPQKDIGVEQRPGMNEKSLHRDPLPA